VSKFWIALIIFFVVKGVSAQVISVPHGGDLPTKTLLVKALKPKALVLLFPGGGGMAKIQDDGSAISRHTFVRSKDLWAQYNIDAVLVDSPYDLGDLRRGNLRGREDHLTRVSEVVNFYKTKTNLPIWIFGHSMGSSTASYFANKYLQTSPIAGIIIAGTITTASLDDEFTLPVLAIHHRYDSCAGTPVNASSRVIEGRPPTLVSKLEIIEGGITEGGVCESFAYHGFNQTEPEFIKRAAQFILSH
jgi:hypothetical protein